MSILYHSLQGAETYAKYASDARSAGDDELVEFFEECRSGETERAAKAKALLADRLELEGDEGDEGESADDDDDADDEELP